MVPTCFKLHLRWGLLGGTKPPLVTCCWWDNFLTWLGLHLRWAVGRLISTFGLAVDARWLVLRTNYVDKQLWLS